MSIASRSGVGVKLATVARAAVVAFAIALLPQGVWSALMRVNLRLNPRIPWAVAAMGLLLWLMWRYLGGAFPPRRTAASRRRYLRATRVSPNVLTWSLLAGGFSLVALSGFWIVFASLIRLPGSVLPSMTGVPEFVVVAAVVAGAAVSPLCEQAGIFGYGQVMLRREFSRRGAIVLSALIFAVGPHPPFGVALVPKIIFFFLVGLTFSIAADLTGSILPGLAVHAVGLLMFFLVIWPRDPSRTLVATAGVDAWFMLHAAQAAVFTFLAVMTFRHLERMPEGSRQLAVEYPTPVGA